MQAPREGGGVLAGDGASGRTPARHAGVVRLAGWSIVLLHRLQRVADRYESKYGWHYTVRDGTFHGDSGNMALVYEVLPTTAFGKGKFSQTRWRF